jgi:hypothetical protein
MPLSLRTMQLLITILSQRRDRKAPFLALEMQPGQGFCMIKYCTSCLKFIVNLQKVHKVS